MESIGSLLLTLLIGAIIGAIAGAITKRGRGGFIWNIVAGLVGSWIGQYLFGSWGPVIAGFAIIPSLIDAVVLVLATSWFAGKMTR